MKPKRWGTLVCLSTATLVLLVSPRAAARTVDEMPGSLWNWRRVQHQNAPYSWMTSSTMRQPSSRSSALDVNTKIERWGYFEEAAIIGSDTVTFDKQCLSNGSQCLYRLNDVANKIICYASDSMVFSCVQRP